ncbi:MAG: hypothetical protein ACFE0I_19110 [Elainellaceae cyanobacterium]
MWQFIRRPLRELRPWHLALKNLRFWLPLLVLGFSFWTVGTLMTLQILNRSYQTSRYFIATIPSETALARQISSIKVKIYTELDFSIAEVTSEDPNLLEREFQYALIEPQEIERAIAQELEIPLEDVRRVIYYKVVDR